MFEIKYNTQLEQELLRFLSLHPDTEFHLRDLSRAIGRSVSGTHTAMKGLEGSNLVLSRFSGRNKYFRVGNDSSIRFFKIFRSTLEVTALIRPFMDHIQKAVLYGSSSRGEDTSRSDFDLFLISSFKEGLRDLPKRLRDRPVNLRIVDGSELILLRKNDPGYIAEVEKGIEIWRA
jgi:predicted nucleotidyltransferase